MLRSPVNSAISIPESFSSITESHFLPLPLVHCQINLVLSTKSHLIDCFSFCLTVRRHMYYIICVWVFSDSVWNEASTAWEFAEIPRFCKAGEVQRYTQETESGAVLSQVGTVFLISLVLSLCILVDYQHLKDKNQASAPIHHSPFSTVSTGLCSIRILHANGWVTNGTSHH